jgi:hypothetical protein
MKEYTVMHHGQAQKNITDLLKKDVANDNIILGYVNAIAAGMLLLAITPGEVLKVGGKLANGGKAVLVTAVANMPALDLQKIIASAPKMSSNVPTLNILGKLSNFMRSSKQQTSENHSVNNPHVITNNTNN